MSAKQYLIVMLIFALIITLSFKCPKVLGSYPPQYIIEVHTDGSALWIIEKKGINLRPDFDEFIYKVQKLVSVVQTLTQRNMSIPRNGFFMTYNVSGSYRIIRYGFHWKGFAQVRESEILIGDVFNLENFFNYLYGNGAVIIKYPPGYKIESVSPPPHERDDAALTIQWYGIEDFKLGEPKILLKPESRPPSPFQNSPALIVILLALALGITLGLYYFKPKEKTEQRNYNAAEEKLSGKFESEEEIIINLLKASGGRMRQSAIAEKCGFSRSKTSKLLKRLEQEGKIERKTKGREKIVSLPGIEEK